MVQYCQPIGPQDKHLKVTAVMDLRRYIRDIPDFPTPGILFKDITPLIKDPAAFQYAVDEIARHYSEESIDAVVGIEARGFVFAAPLALKLKKPLIPVRKEGKLPFETHTVRYVLEYGESAVQVHIDAIEPRQRVLIVDDLLATGGTLEAAAKLVADTGGLVVGLAVVVELTDLHGRERLSGHNILSLIRF